MKQKGFTVILVDQTIDIFGSEEGQKAIDWALSQWNTAPSQCTKLVADDINALLYPRAVTFAALCAVDNATSLSVLLRLQLRAMGMDARAPGKEEPGKDGAFVTIGAVDGVDEPLIEIDTPEQVQTHTIGQARAMLSKLRDRAGRRQEGLASIVRGGE